MDKYKDQSLQIDLETTLPRLSEKLKFTKFIIENPISLENRNKECLKVEKKVSKYLSRILVNSELLNNSNDNVSQKELLDLRKYLEYMKIYDLRSNFTDYVFQSGANWIAVGMLFANGEMKKLREQFNSAGEIARFKFGKENESKFRPYISSTIANSTKSDKNIYSNRFKMAYLISSLESKEIHIDEDFMKQYNLLTSQ